MAHYERLEQFAELMFSDPAFVKNGVMHPGVTQIRQALKNHKEDETDHTNMAIGLRDIEDREVEEDTLGLIGRIVPLNGRMVVVNTDHRNWLSQETLYERHPILKLLSKKETHNPKKPYRVVTDCTAKENVSIFSDSSSFTAGNQISYVKKGAQLKNLYRPQGFDGPVEIKIVGSNSSSFQRGWIKDLESFECSEDYYSSSDKAEIIDSK